MVVVGQPLLSAIAAQEIQQTILMQCFTRAVAELLPASPHPANSGRGHTKVISHFRLAPSDSILQLVIVLN